LYDAANFLVSSDDRIQFAESGKIGKISAEFIQSLILLFGIRFRYSL
jgi:hypothetical protein